MPSRFFREIRAALAENAEFARSVPDSPGTLLFRRAGEVQSDLFRRYLRDPWTTTAEEFAASIYLVEAAGRWRLDVFGVDVGADRRSRRIDLLSRVERFLEGRKPTNSGDFARSDFRGTKTVDLQGLSKVIGSRAVVVVAGNPHLIRLEEMLAEHQAALAQEPQGEASRQRLDAAVRELEHQLRLLRARLQAGERLRAARRAKGLTQADLGSMIRGSGKRQISRYENGNPPDDRHLLMLAEALDVPVAYLTPFYGDEGEE